VQQGDQRGKEWLVESERRIAEAAALRARLDAARTEGRHGEALDLAARLRTDHPRSGTLLDQLPLPGRLRVFDADSRAPIAGFSVVVDGVTVVGDDGRFCRQSRSETAIEVSARGYLPSRLAVTPVADAGERQVEAFLTPAPAWRIAGVRTGNRPPWLRLAPVGQQHALLLVPDAALRVAAGDGAQRPMAVPGTQVAAFWLPTPTGCVYATRDGELREVRAQADQPAIWRRLPTAPVALLDCDSSLRVGSRLTAAIEDLPSGRTLVLREGARELWRRGGIEGQQEPVLRRVDERLAVIDDNAVHLFDETGEPQPRYPLKGVRSGQVVEIANGRLLVPTVAGVEVLHAVGSGVRSIDVPWLSAAGQAVVAAAGDAVLIARNDRQVELAEWKAEPRPRWSKRISGRPAFAAVGHGAAVVVDEAGDLTAWRISDGQPLRHAALALPPACPPLVLPGAILAADLGGTVSAWRLP
jgi:hypothetical protein